MKPQVLDNIQIDFQWPKIASAVMEELDSCESRIRRGGGAYLGEVDPQAVRNDDPLIAKLLDVGREHGLVFRQQGWYMCSSYLPIRGSVPWHDDSGIGLLLNWLVKSKDLVGYKDCLSHNDCHLLTRHGQLEITVGDIFVFNGNIGHAWVSNSQCMLVQTSVKAIRNTKRG